MASVIQGTVRPRGTCPPNLTDVTMMRAKGTKQYAKNVFVMNIIIIINYYFICNEEHTQKYTHTPTHTHTYKRKTVNSDDNK